MSGAWDMNISPFQRPSSPNMDIRDFRRKVAAQVEMREYVSGLNDYLHRVFGNKAADLQVKDGTAKFTLRNFFLFSTTEIAPAFLLGRKKDDGGLEELKATKEIHAMRNELQIRVNLNWSMLRPVVYKNFDRIGPEVIYQP